MEEEKLLTEYKMENVGRGQMLTPVKLTKTQKRLLELNNVIPSGEFGDPVYILRLGEVLKTYDWVIFYIITDYSVIPKIVLDVMYEINKSEKHKIQEAHMYQHFYNS